MKFHLVSISSLPTTVSSLQKSGISLSAARKPSREVSVKTVLNQRKKTLNSVQVAAVQRTTLSQLTIVKPYLHISPSQAKE
jgi:hypothetical protein